MSVHVRNIYVVCIGKICLTIVAGLQAIYTITIFVQGLDPLRIWSSSPSGEEGVFPKGEHCVETRCKVMYNSYIWKKTIS